MIKGLQFSLLKLR